MAGNLNFVLRTAQGQQAHVVVLYVLLVGGRRAAQCQIKLASWSEFVCIIPPEKRHFWLGGC